MRQGLKFAAALIVSLVASLPVVAAEPPNFFIAIKLTLSALWTVTQSLRTSIWALKFGGITSI